MTWLDILLLLPLPIGLGIGIKRGLVLELTAVISILFAYLCVHFIGTPLAAWMVIEFAWTEAICTVVAYSSVFLIVSVIINLIGRLISKLIKVIYLGWLNHTLGAVFGLIKWSAIVIFTILCIHRLDQQYHFLEDDLKTQSVIYNSLTPLSEINETAVKEEIIEKSMDLPEEDIQLILGQLNSDTANN